MPNYPPWVGSNEYDAYDRKAPVAVAPPCRESHPVLSLGGGKFAGGSCFHPPEDFDIYVGLDRNMERHDYFPWDEGPHPVDICYPITDGCAPKNPANFKKLVEYLKERLAEGKKVAIGCMGGHGRTGMVLAALYKEISGEPDAIKWVRDNYCKKAVESRSQVDFLMKHFGIKRQVGSKEYLDKPKAGSPWSGGKTTFVPSLPGRDPDKATAMPDPGARAYTIWGDNVRLTNV